MVVVAGGVASFEGFLYILPGLRFAFGKFLHLGNMLFTLFFSLAFGFGLRNFSANLSSSPKVRGLVCGVVCGFSNERLLMKDLRYERAKSSRAVLSGGSNG
jgi:hypothetical protein